MEEKIFLEFIKKAYETGHLSGYEYENLKEKLEKETTAKEMFEELGYVQEIKNNVIYYFKKIDIPKSHIIYDIDFIIDTKEIFISKTIDLEELKAINKQVEELGWN